MKINKIIVAMSLVVFGMCFGLNGMKADAAFVKKTEVKKMQKIYMN